MKKIFLSAYLAVILFEFVNFARLIHIGITPDYTWFGLTVTALFIFALLEFAEAMLRRRKQPALPPWVWGVLLVPLLVDVIGDLFHLYSGIAWYDQVGHFTGGVFGMFALYGVINAFTDGNRFRIPEAMRLLFPASLALALGSIYEIEEYLEDFFSRSHRLGDAWDTPNDMLMNLCGITVAVVLLVFARQRKRSRRP